MLGMAVLFLVNGCQKPMTPDPTLELSQAEVAVPAEGGTYSVAFKVTNPKDGAEVTVAAPEVEWITNFVVGETDITFDVAENQTEDARSVKVTVSYPGVEPDAEFTISQEAGEPEPFTIDVRDITQTSATFDIVPYDKEMYFISFYATQEYIDENGLNTDDALFADDLEYIKGEMEYYGDDIYAYVYQGDVLTDIEISGLTPESDNVVYAYGFDPETMERLTDIIYCRFTTLPAEKMDVDFIFGEPIVEGPRVTVQVTPDNYDGYWTAYALETSSIDPETSLFDMCNDSWSSLVSIFQMFGYTTEEILEENCIKGETSIRFDLDPSTSYTIAVLAINDQALAASDPSTLEVTTSAVQPSDNVISIEITEITGTSAMVSFTPSNDDPYAFDVYPASAFEGLSNSEIVDLCLSNAPNETYGYFSSKLSGIEPQTSYTAIAFGYQSGVVTTEPFMYTFTTADPVIGTIDFELKFDDYYDLAGTADAMRASGYTDEADYFDSMVNYGLDAILPVEAVTTPEVGTFYYTVFADIPENHTDDPNEYIDFLLSSGNTDKTGYYTFYYDMALFAVGVAFDDAGEPGPLWISEPFTLTKDGASDPQGFIDYLFPSNTTSLKAFAASKDNGSQMNMSTASRVERFTPSAAPSTIDRTSYNGGEVEFVRPLNFKSPEFTGNETPVKTGRGSFRK